MLNAFYKYQFLETFSKSFDLLCIELSAVHGQASLHKTSIYQAWKFCNWSKIQGCVLFLCWIYINIKLPHCPCWLLPSPGRWTGQVLGAGDSWGLRTDSCFRWRRGERVGARGERGGGSSRRRRRRWRGGVKFGGGERARLEGDRGGSHPPTDQINIFQLPRPKPHTESSDGTVGISPDLKTIWKKYKKN